jgi:hypothetical protein
MPSGTYEIDSEIIASRNNDGSIVAMKVDDSDLFYKITGVATEVWSYLEQGLSRDEIVKNITESFEVTEEQSIKDFDTFITDLKKYKILTEK